MFLISLLVSFLLMSCHSNTHSNNAYYDRMKSLKGRIENNHDQNALRELINHTKDWNYWNRYYAYAFIEVLANDNMKYTHKDEDVVEIVVIKDVKLQRQIMPIIINALKNDDPAIKRDAASTITGLDSSSINLVAKYLIKNIDSLKGDDVYTFSIEAIGGMSDQSLMPEALNALFKAAKNKPVSGDDQDRNHAIDAIIKISKKRKCNILSRLKLLLDSNDPHPEFQENLAKVILKIDPKDTKAKEVLKILYKP